MGGKIIFNKTDSIPNSTEESLVSPNRNIIGVITIFIFSAQTQAHNKTK